MSMPRLTSRPLAGLSVLLTGLALAAGSVVVLAPQVGAPVAAQDRDALGSDLDALLAHPGLVAADVGLVVRSADDGEVLYRRGGERRQQPASNAKLVTAAAALEVLGPDHRFTTEVRAPGRDTGPVHHGDLHLRGTGDPTMLAADYDALAARVASTGLRVVTGALVADDTWFDGERLGLGWAWDDEPFYYNAQVSALTAAPDTDFDAGSIIVTVAPATAGMPAIVETQPATDHVRIVGTVTTGEPGSRTSVSVSREHGTNTITVSGSIAETASPVRRWVAVWDPTGYAASLFRAALTRHGVEVLGPTTRGATPEGATLVSDRQSMPLRDLTVPFMKLSNNLHAEILVKSMGRATAGVGSWAAGRAAVSGVLPRLGLDPATVFLVDGSGLSRMDHISTDQLSAVLMAARSKPWFPVLFDALPVAGVADRMVGGTLRSRMRGTPAAGNLRAKTGSLTGVSALSGYVTAASGEHLVFAMVTNNVIGVNVRAIEDAVGARLAAYAGAEDRNQPAPLLAPVDEPYDAHHRSVLDLECSWLKAC